MEPNEQPRTWRDDFDDRQLKQIDFAHIYARSFGHGADGHNNMLIIDKMATLLDAAEATFAAYREYRKTE